MIGLKWKDQVFYFNVKNTEAAHLRGLLASCLDEVWKEQNE